MKELLFVVFFLLLLLFTLFSYFLQQNVLVLSYIFILFLPSIPFLKHRVIPVILYSILLPLSPPHTLVTYKVLTSASVRIAGFVDFVHVLNSK
jgi:hypothetical protein